MKNPREHITYENRQKIGKRLKAEAKERNLRTDDVADLISYSSGKQISPIYSGTRAISYDRIETLAKAWNLRVDYLLCIDDWKTDEQMLEYAKESDISSFKSCMDYLSTLGFCFKPTIKTILSMRVARRNWDKIKEYLTDDSISRIESAYDFSIDCAELSRNHFFSRELVTLKRPFDHISIDFDEIGKETGLVDSDVPFDTFSNTISVSCDKSLIKVNTTYEICYQVFYNNEYRCDCSVSQLQRFIKQLDSFTTFIVKSLLLNDT